MKPDTLTEQPVFTTGTCISDSSSRVTWFPGLLSIGVHVTAVTLALIPWAASVRAPRQTATEVVLYTPAPPLMLPRLPDRSSGGGGGGMRTPTPPSFGRPPRGADKQLVPPTPEVKNVAPELIAEPTIVAPQLSNLPQISLLPLGDSEGILGPPSGGPGSDGGIGSGKRHGVGPDDGPGAGPGERAGTGDKPDATGSTGSLTMPVAIYRPDPNYSEDARKARFQGTVTLQTIVRKDGSVEVVGVVRSPGYGLDQEAVKTVRQWRFRPGTQNGQPIDIQLAIEVNFRIL